MPKIKFLSKELAKQKKNASRALAQQETPQKARSRAPEESEDDGDEDLDERSSSEEEENEEGIVEATTPEKVSTAISDHPASIALLTASSIVQPRTHQVRPHVRAQKPKHPVRALHKARGT